MSKRFCFTWFAGAPLAGADRGVLLKAARWQPGDLISVSFLDGVRSIQNKVKKYALAWTAPGRANLRFSFRTDTNDTLIRISFQQSGSWSTLGTTCRSVTDITQPTMNFGWLRAGSSDDEIRRVTIHEFGHALGLVHEHQNPAGGIHWNKEQVYMDLGGPPNNWPREVVDRNVFDPYSREETNFTELDPLSIMMYPIPETWTTDGFSVGLNPDLSETDKTFIEREYP